MEDTKSLHDKLFRIKDELRVTQENFISRERAYKLRIEELEEESYRKRQEKTGWMKSDHKICQLKAMQSQILSNVAIVQDRFSRIIQEQEKDLLKAFQARLLDVQAELESQKSKKDDGASAYIELSKAKEYDVEREKVKADQRERQNQALLQSNNRLKSQFASREEDRNYLVMQINSARNDNARLKVEYAELEKEQARLQEQVEPLLTIFMCTFVPH
jgi:chromosome segregation ATPase